MDKFDELEHLLNNSLDVKEKEKINIQTELTNSRIMESNYFTLIETEKNLENYKEIILNKKKIYFKICLLLFSAGLFFTAFSQLVAFGLSASLPLKIGFGLFAGLVGMGGFVVPVVETFSEELNIIKNFDLEETEEQLENIAKIKEDWLEDHISVDRVKEIQEVLMTKLNIINDDIKNLKLDLNNCSKYKTNAILKIYNTDFLNENKETEINNIFESNLTLAKRLTDLSTKNT